MPHDYDDTDLTSDEMIEMAARTFDDADIAEPIPTDGLTEEELEDLAISRSEGFDEILSRSQQRLEPEGCVTSEEVRRRFGLIP
jgi:hypothetical protein